MGLCRELIRPSFWSFFFHFLSFFLLLFFFFFFPSGRGEFSCLEGGFVYSFFSTVHIMFTRYISHCTIRPDYSQLLGTVHTHHHR